ncbi:MAG TPA: hypothetical protein VF286_13955, partial [Acidiphilium sp.]
MDTLTTFDAVLAEDRFAARHIGPDAAERTAMLRELGIASIGALIARTVPGAILAEKPLDLPPAMTEGE